MDTNMADLFFSNGFKFTSPDEKIKIILKGRPRPSLCTFIVYDGENLEVEELYEKEKYVTIDERTDDIYCWPCLLFPIDSEPKHRRPVSNSNNKKWQKNFLNHKNSSDHINSLFQYTLFKNKYSVNSEKLPDVCQENWLIKRNHAVLKRIIDVCYSLLPTSPPDETNGDFLKVEKCIQILTLMRSYDTHIVEEAINLAKACPAILPHSVAAIAYAMKEAIKSELQSTTCVALILSMHSKSSKLSTVCRYVYEGKICERLIDFTYLDTSISATCIQQHVSKLISEFEISQKLLLLSCDGAVLSTTSLSHFVTSFLKQNPLYFFVPSHLYDFCYILEQSLSKYSKCDLFFKTLTAMNAFFRDNSKACSTFDTITKGKFPNLSKLKLNNFQFLRLLKLYRRKFVIVFSRVIEQGNVFAKEDIAKVIGFQSTLEQYQTLFMLEAFFMLFNRIAILIEMLNSSSPENVFNQRFLKFIKTSLTKDRNHGFEILWTNVMNEMVKNSSPEMLNSVGEEETKQLQEFYTKIVNCILKEINIRFSCADKLEFLSILNNETNDKLILSDYQMESLKALKGTLLDEKRLKIELKSLCKNGAIFGGKCVREIIDILLKANFQKTYTNVHKLTELILTMPTVSSLNSSSSKIESINSWYSIPNTSEMFFLCQLCIERDYLTFLKSRITFNEQVIVKLKEFMQCK